MSLGSTFKHSLYLSAAVAACIAGPAWAQTKTFNLPAQDAVTALPAFARQAGIQVFAPESILRGKRTQPVIGAYSAEAGLARLLSGTGLEVASNDGRTVVLRQRPQDEAAVGDDGGPTEVAEVSVTGSRLQMSVGSEPIAFKAFDKEDIDGLGVTSVADVLNYLPQQSFSIAERNNNGGRFVQLRGLGLGTTLVLINGQRTGTAANQAGRGAVFDLNAIPLAAVDRVEVLSDSASAVYGADAVGGVVNIILKKAVEKTTLDLYHGGTHGGGDENRSSITTGYQGSRFRTSLVIDLMQRAVLMGSKRDLTADADYRRFGDSDSRSRNSNPGNITSTTTANLPGLSSRFAAVPLGITGRPTVANFQQTAGQVNLGPGFAYYGSILPKTKRWSGFATANYDLTENIDIFAEGSYTSNTDITFSTPLALSGTIVPASNAFNPFGVPVSVNYLFEELPVERVSKGENSRVLVGLRGDVGSWRWEASLLRMDDRAKSYAKVRFDALRLSAALASADPAQALNVFVQGPAGSPALTASLLAPPIVDSYRSAATEAGAFLSGEALSLPAGKVAWVFGDEARREKLNFNAVTSNLFLPAARDVTAAFFEMRVPLVNDGMAVPFVENLALTAAGRVDRYSDFGSTFNPQVSLDWHLSGPLRLRATYGTSFRPPSLFQLYSPAIEFEIALNDQRRGNLSTPFTQRLGGNSALDPEEAAVYSAGFSFEPPWWSGGRLAINGWKIAMKERTQGLSVSVILANESIFADRVVRATPTAADVAAGIPGQILRIDTATLNYGELKTSGVDFQVSQSIPVSSGRLQLSANATWVRDYEAANLPNTPPVDRVGVANSAGSIPEWRSTLSATWSQGALGVSAAYRYVSAYQDATTTNVANGRRLPSSKTFDAQASIDLGQILDSTNIFSGTVLRVGVRNLFDKASPYAAVNGLGYDASQGDLRQRFGYVSLSSSF